MKSKLYFWSMVSALAGFLFGFDCSCFGTYIAKRNHGNLVAGNSFKH